MSTFATQAQDNREERVTEKALIIGVCPGRMKMKEAELHLAELARLADTANAEVVGATIQKMPKINATTLVGPGKLHEIGDRCIDEDINLIIFDEELTGSQVKNIEKVIGEVKVLDRSSLILDIFALHARTAESKMMVEIAQMEYTMPRLTNMWTHLCRQVGGIGTRGPGESQLESDKRQIQKRISDLKKRLKKIEKSRVYQANSRKDAFHIATVGYTNAGKSTLTKALTKADLYIADRLFATLDSTTRQIPLGESRNAIMSDTVGFIRKLPHHLVASFKSTLGVVREADLVMHVVDGTADDFMNHIEVANEVLDDLAHEDSTSLLVINKADALSIEKIDILREAHPEAILVSALEEIGVQTLIDKLALEHDLWRDRSRTQKTSSRKKNGWSFEEV